MVKKKAVRFFPELLGLSSSKFFSLAYYYFAGPHSLIQAVLVGIVIVRCCVMICNLCLKFIYVASSQPLWWHNTNGGKGVLCMHVLRVCLVCGKGMVSE